VYRFTDLVEKRDKTVLIGIDAKWPKELSMNNPIIGAMHNKQDISFNFILQNE
jgi:hypothetical protein